MSRTLLSALAALAAVVSLVFAATAPAAPVKVTGKVGPGETISLTIGGREVTKLKAGVAYRFVVSDRASDHDFRILGPGVNKAITGVAFVGTKSVVLRLRKGAYRFFCAPHADEMRGGFTAS